ncbi:MAG TPA: hypothetical protein VK537_07640 [Galbitalea sp.]|nr:hypothetical protein [Galbitalea sp.]
MFDLTTLFAMLCGPAVLHHPVMVLPFEGYQGLVGVMHWGA